MTFTNGIPRKPFDYINMGLNVTPCKNKKPILKDWQNKKVSLQEWETKYQGFEIGLVLNGHIDFDIDNHYIKKFIKYLKSCGAIFGRQSNPLSHYMFSGEVKPYKYVLPKELEKYCKDFSHGATLAEIRSGHGFQTIVPESSNDSETVTWNHFAGFNEYKGDLQRDIGTIALSGALSILYPPKGNRDNFCTAIAGVLASHTDRTAGDIDEFVYTIAVLSNDENAKNKMTKGTNAKNPKTKNLGIPTLAEIVGCSNSTIGKLFSWIGINDSGSCFTALKCYTTDPKYWQIQYKGQWITVMDSSILLSYTKMSILILENCYEVAPVIGPKEWKDTLAGLLKNVEKIDAPVESSYYGVIAGVFINWLELNAKHNKATKDDFRFNLGSFGTSVRYEGDYWFKLEGVTQELKRRQMSFEMRKLTHFLREEFGCVPTKITIDKRELRAWKVPCVNIEEHTRHNTDVEGQLKKNNERLDKIEKETGSRYKGKTPF